MKLSQHWVSATVGTLKLGDRILGRRCKNVPDLSPEILMRTARRRARLEDFGTWPFEDPLQRLVASYQREANLTLVGRLCVRELILSLLQNLLYLEQERQASTEVERQIIDAPIFIVGLPRTGTTLLHGLMGQDPAVKTPTTWEVMYPAGYPETPTAVNRAKRRTATRLDWADRLAPELKRIHPIGPALPQECVALMAQAFTSQLFHTMHDVPSYQNWLENNGLELAYDIHYRMLQHLQARRGNRRWVLKAPAHLFSLGPLLRRYPDARIIHTHRDPLTAIPSIASLNTVLRRAFSADVDRHAVAADWSGRWAKALDGFLLTRDRSPPAQFFDIAYDTLVTSPLEAVAQIYQFLGWSLEGSVRAEMARFRAANPKNKHGAHRYTLSEFGLEPGFEARRYANYRERFCDWL